MNGYGIHGIIYLLIYADINTSKERCASCQDHLHVWVMTIVHFVVAWHIMHQIVALLGAASVLQRFPQTSPGLDPSYQQ